MPPFLFLRCAILVLKKTKSKAYSPIAVCAYKKTKKPNKIHFNQLSNNHLLIIHKRTRMSYIIKARGASAQEAEQEEYLLLDDFILPAIDPSALLRLYEQNVYHKRSLNLKAKLLSNTIDTDITKFLTIRQKEFLYSFALDLEIYGNAYIEKAGTPNNYYLYNLLGFQGRVDKYKNIYQHLRTGMGTVRLEGFHLKYMSPKSLHYGEPDYLAVTQQIAASKKADVYNSKYFDNGAKPEHAIIFEGAAPTEKQKEAFAEFFDNKFRGLDNSHKTLIMWADSTSGDKAPKIRIEKIGEVEDLSFENLKKVARDEIVASHGVPPRLVGVITPGQLGGGKELIDQLHLFEETVLKDKRQLIEEFFASIGLKVKLSPLDVTTFKDDADLVTSLVQAQIISTQEAKQLLGYVGT